MGIAYLGSTISGPLAENTQRLEMVRHRRGLISWRPVSLKASPLRVWRVMPSAGTLAGAVGWSLHVLHGLSMWESASSHRGGWAQEQEIGLAWKPAGRHFLQVTGAAVAEPRLSQRWVGRCSGHGWSELCKEFGGQCFKSPAGFILISSVSVLVTTPFSDGEMAGSRVD